MTKELPTTITSAGARTLRFTISTANPDRANDTIDPRGWHLDDFRRNPVVLWSHSKDVPPIARATDIRVVGNRLVASAEFAPKAIHPLADQIYQLLKAGFLTGASVGFKPIKWQRNDAGGISYQEQSLLEFSVCSVPAHPEALLETRANKAAVMKWLASKPSDGEIVFRLKADPLPQPRYRIDPAMLGTALAMSLSAALASPEFKAHVRSTVDARVAVAVRRMRGRLD